MRQVIRALFVVAGFVLLGIALFHAVRLGFEGDERALGASVRDAVVVVACLAGLVAMWWADRALARAAENRKLLRLARGFEADRLVARVGWGWRLVLPLLVAAMAAVPLALAPGLFVHFELKPALAALAGAFAALLLAAIFLPYLWRRGPALVLDAEAATHILYGRIPWAQVHGIRLRELDMGKGTKQITLVLGVDDIRPWVANLPAPHRWLGMDRRDRQLRALSIPLNLLDVDPDLVHLAATTLRDRVSPPRLAHWAPGLDPAFVAASGWLDANHARIEALMGRMEQAEALTKTGSTGERALAQAELERLVAEMEAAMKETSAAVDALVARRPS
jgi:hypothetical protein